MKLLRKISRWAGSRRALIKADGPDIKRYWPRLGLAIAVLFVLDNAYHLDTIAYDWVVPLFRNPQDMGKGILIVRLTDESADFPGRRSALKDFHYPRESLARVIDEVSKARPRAIVVDVLLDRPDAPEKIPGGLNPTVELEQSIATAMRRTQIFLAQDVDFDENPPRVEPLLDIFTSKVTGYAPSFFREDEDRVVRSFPVGLKVGEKIIPTLPSLVVKAPPRKSFSGEIDQYRLNFHIMNTDAFPKVAAEGLIAYNAINKNKESPFPLLTNKINANTIVILAPDYATSHDFFPVPRWAGDGRGLMRGPILLAYAIETLRSRRYHAELEGWMSMLFWVTALFFGFGLTRWGPEFFAEGYLWLLMPFLYLAGALSLAWGTAYYLPMAEPVAAFVIGRHVAEDFERWRDKEGAGENHSQKKGKVHESRIHH